jgi:hypothetical protein
MTLETNLQSIADSLAIIAQHLVNSKAPIAAPVVAAAPAVAPVPVVAAPVAAPVVISTVMPALPTFDLPVVAPTTAPAATVPPPFANKQAMTDFVLASYKALGAEKGAKIQDVLVSLGCKNINDVPEAQWGALKAGVEALK